MSDWGATHSTSIMAGLDQEMPGASYMGPAVAAGLAAGNITQAAIDESVTRILTGMFSAGVIDTYAKDKMAYHYSKREWSSTLYTAVF
jgi:beta-glucosidase